MLQRTLLALLLTAVSTANAFAQGTVFLVRHAERADANSGPPMMASDPGLSQAGRARAESLATVLKDAGITAIYVTEYKRTQETAAPLANALGIRVTSINAKDMAALVDRLARTTTNVLVVGHSNTVPEVVKALGVATPLAIGDGEFDNLLVVVPGPPPRLLRLHYR
jgi:broad specificity phosphatase PhoE